MNNGELPHGMSSSLSPQELEAIVDFVIERLTQDSLPQFMDERAAAKFVGLTHRSLQAMRYDGTGPAFVKVGSSQRAPIRYSRSDLIRWMHSRRRYHSTAEIDGQVER